MGSGAGVAQVQITHGGPECRVGAVKLWGCAGVWGAVNTGTCTDKKQKHARPKNNNMQCRGGAGRGCFRCKCGWCRCSRMGSSKGRAGKGGGGSAGVMGRVGDVVLVAGRAGVIAWDQRVKCLWFLRGGGFPGRVCFTGGEEAGERFSSPLRFG